MKFEVGFWFLSFELRDQGFRVSEFRVEGLGFSLRVSGIRIQVWVSI